MARGEFITDAAVEAGTYRKQGARWLVAARPWFEGPLLTLSQREEIALGGARGQSASEAIMWWSSLGRVFRYRIGDTRAQAEAVAWGRASGTPEHQLDWGD